MYLEISPRQTGKTNRLVEAAANKCIEISNTWSKELVLILAVNHRRARDIVERISDRISEVAPGRADVLKNTVHCTSEGKNYLHTDPFRGSIYTDIKYLNIFCDEFDHVGAKNIIMSDTGYYCTTAHFARTSEHVIRHACGEPDVLLELLQRNGGRHVTHSITNMMEDMTLRDIRRMKSEMAARGNAELEFGNQYLKW